jgi:hypothetical protein
MTRPIILHGLHPPAPTPPIIRLQRPITVPSALYNGPSQTSTATNLVHQFIPALKPALPTTTVFRSFLSNRMIEEENRVDNFMGLLHFVLSLISLNQGFCTQTSY